MISTSDPITKLGGTLLGRFGQRLLAAPALALLLAGGPLLVATPLLGCNNGGSEKPSDDPAHDDDDDDVDLDECPSLCDEAIEATSELGCDLTCGVDVGFSFDGEANATVLVLSQFAHVEVDGEIVTGTCDFVSVCPDPTPCQVLYTECLQESADPQLCGAIYSDCEQETHCQEEHSGCNEMAAVIYNDCIDAGTPVDECQQGWVEAGVACVCLLDACVLGTSGEECAEDNQQAAMLPPPLQLSDARWQVSRQLVTAQLARLGSLERQLATWPVRDTDGFVRGMRLRSLEKTDLVYQLGLRDGDLLRTVNGHAVTDLIRKPAALRALYGAQAIRLGIERDDTTQLLSYVLTD